MNLEELKSFADEADRRGDTEAANAAFDKILAMQESPISANEFDNRNILQKGADWLSEQGVSGAAISPVGAAYGFVRKNDFFTPEPVPALVRAGASIKTTPEGRAGFIQSQMGNTTPDPLTGKPMVTVGGSRVPFDDQRISVSDVAGLSGPAISFGPNAALALTGYGASPPAQAVASGAGTAMREAASSLLPGGGQNLEGAIGNVAKDTALSYGFAKGTQIGADAFNYLRPRNFSARAYKEESVTPFAKEGSRLSKETGVDLTAGRETGSDALLTAENKVKQSLSGRRYADEYYARALKQSEDYLNRTIKSLDSENLSKEGFGYKALSTTEKATDAAYTARSVSGQADYAIFNNMTNGGPAIPRSSFSENLNNVLDNYSGTRAAIKKGESLLKEGDLTSGTIPIKQMLDQRRILSKVAAGKGRLFSGLDPGTDKEIAKKLLDGINTDLQSAEGLMGEKFATQLNIANRNWAQNSEKIREIQNSVVGALFNKTKPPTPQEASNALLSLAKAGTSDPIKIKNVVNILDKTDPTFSSSYRAAIANDLFERSTSIVNTNKYSKFSPEAYIQNSLGLDKEAVSALFKKPAEKQAFLDGISINLRLKGASPQMSNILSQEQQAKEAAMFLGGVASGGASPVFASGFLVKWITPKFLSKQIFDKEGQNAMRVIATSNPRTSAYRNAMGILTMRALQEKELDNDTNTLIEQQ